VLGLFIAAVEHPETRRFDMTHWHTMPEAQAVFCPPDPPKFERHFEGKSNAGLRS
jgi:hypothetical protein